jgi:hypothetical protein
LYSYTVRSISPLISRKSSITTEGLEGCKGLIKTATTDLEDHRQRIDEKLEAIFEHTATEAGLDATELRLIKEERMSADKRAKLSPNLRTIVQRY